MQKDEVPISPVLSATVTENEIVGMKKKEEPADVSNRSQNMQHIDGYIGDLDIGSIAGRKLAGRFPKQMLSEEAQSRLSYFVDSDSDTNSVTTVIDEVDGGLEPPPEKRALFVSLANSMVACTRKGSN